MRSLCSSATPRIPAGIVPTMITQARRASRSRGVDRPRTERTKPNQIRFQSSRKKRNRTIAVAQWVATRKERKYSSFWWMFQPNRCGSSTAWPRLEIGNGSEIPCRAPRMIACEIEIGSKARRAYMRELQAGRVPGDETFRRVHR